MPSKEAVKRPGHQGVGKLKCKAGWLFPQLAIWQKFILVASWKDQTERVYRKKGKGNVDVSLTYS